MNQQLIEAKAASLENASSDLRWGFVQGAHWALQQLREQEPVAWIERDISCGDFDPDSVTFQKPTIAAAAGWEWVALYTPSQAPAQPEKGKPT